MDHIELCEILMLDRLSSVYTINIMPGKKRTQENKKEEFLDILKREREAILHVCMCSCVLYHMVSFYKCTYILQNRVLMGYAYLYESPVVHSQNSKHNETYFVFSCVFFFLCLYFL